MIWCNWFDGVHWSYCEQNLEKIRSVEFERLNRVLEQKPDVVLTHFAPLPQKMQPYYEKDIISSYFYFDNKIKGRFYIASETSTSITSAFLISALRQTASKKKL